MTYLAVSFDDERFPVAFEGGIPHPARVPAPPDELRQLIQQYHRGLDRVTIKRGSGRKRFSQINSLRIGAAFEQQPAASVDEICRAVMAIAQDYYEEVDHGCQFQVQAHVYLKATGDPKRKSCHFWLGTDEDGRDAVESMGDPNSFDDVLLGHINQCHDRIMEQSKIICGLGETALANAGEVFKARESALEAQAASNAVIAEQRAEAEAERGKQTRLNRAVDIVEKLAPVVGTMAMNNGKVPEKMKSELMSSMGAIGGALKGENSKGESSSSKTTVVKAPAPTKPPSWASAAGVDTGTGQDAPTSMSSSEQPPAEPEDDGPNPLEHPIAALAYDLFHSIQANQWPKLIGVLTKKQLDLLNSFGSVETDDDAIPAVRKMGSSIKQQQQIELLGVLLADQTSALLKLQQLTAEPEE